MFYIYVWNKRITLKILPCMAALNTFRTDGEDFGEQILSKVVKAGRRTYFLDVRATRANDYFLTITESRKKTYVITKKFGMFPRIGYQRFLIG